jgi:ribosome modulation factor
LAEVHRVRWFAATGVRLHLAGVLRGWTHAVRVLVALPRLPAANRRECAMSNSDSLDPLVAYEDDPRTDRVHHPYSAYNQGWDAREAGHPVEACPYTEEHRHFGKSMTWKDWWVMGWTEAGEEPDDPEVPMPIPPPSSVRARPRRVCAVR